MLLSRVGASKGCASGDTPDVEGPSNELPALFLRLKSEQREQTVCLHGWTAAYKLRSNQSSGKGDVYMWDEEGNAYRSMVALRRRLGLPEVVQGEDSCKRRTPSNAAPAAMDLAPATEPAASSTSSPASAAVTPLHNDQPRQLLQSP